MTSKISVAYLQSQCHDGWWPYQPGNADSLESTAWCAIACSSNRQISEAALKYLVSQQNTDGGWSTSHDAGASDWSTGLALLALNVLQRKLNLATTNAALNNQVTNAQDRGFKRLTKQRTEIVTDLSRFTMMLLEGADFDYPRGWPWAHDTYNWVEPTSYAILSIKTGPYARQKHYLNVVKEAQQYMLDKVCAEGGWNFGSPRTLAADWPSMPPPTALAVIAMQDLKNKQIDKALAFLSSRKSPSANSVLSASLALIALHTHGQDTAAATKEFSEHVVNSDHMGDNLSTLALATIASNLSKDNPLKLPQS